MSLTSQNNRSLFTFLYHQNNNKQGYTVITETIDYRDYVYVSSSIIYAETTWLYTYNMTRYSATVDSYPGSLSLN